MSFLSQCVSFSSSSYTDKAKVINSPDSNDSGIQADVQQHVHHIQGPRNDDLYAVVSKPKKQQEAKSEKQVGDIIQ